MDLRYNLLGEKCLVDDGRDVEEWVAHSEEDSIVVVSGSHFDESKIEKEKFRFRSDEEGKFKWVSVKASVYNQRAQRKLVHQRHLLFLGLFYFVGRLCGPGFMPISFYFINQTFHKNHMHHTW